MSITLEYPWLLFVIVAPYFMFRFFPAYLQPSASLYIPFFQRVVEATGQTPHAGAVAQQRKMIQLFALLLCWLGLVVCLARPVLLGEVQITQKAARDLMIAVDLSQSMEQKDYFIGTGNDSVNDKVSDNKPQVNQQAISRIEALKSVLAEFALQREGDRLGLIVFGSGAYLQVPFTQDVELWLTLLNEMDTQMAGPATAIGDAIGLSIRAFSQSRSQQRLLLLVTDGSDTHSRLDAVDAARVAASDAIQIVTLGMGDPKTKGDDKVDFNSLQKIAKVSNGNSYIASDSDSLQKVFSDINNIAPASYEQQHFQPKRDLYPWIMGPLLIFYIFVWLYLTLQGYWLTQQRGKYVN